MAATKPNFCLSGEFTANYFVASFHVGLLLKCEVSVMVKAKLGFFDFEQFEEIICKLKTCPPSLFRHLILYISLLNES